MAGGGVVDECMTIDDYVPSPAVLEPPQWVIDQDRAYGDRLTAAGWFIAQDIDPTITHIMGDVTSTPTSSAASAAASSAASRAGGLPDVFEQCDTAYQHVASDEQGIPGAHDASSCDSWPDSVPGVSQSWCGDWEQRVRGELEAALSGPGLPGITRTPGDTHATTKGAGQVLAGLAPGPELAALLAGTDLDTLPDFEVVEYIHATDRLVSWAQARQLHAISVLDQRPTMAPPWPTTAGEVHDPSVTGDEIAMRLKCSKSWATTLVELARTLYTGPLTATGDALETGRITFRGAKLIHDRLEDIDPHIAQRVLAKVLPGAHLRTIPQLGKDLTRELIRTVPHYCAKKTQTARARRRVDRPQPLPDGMAYWAITAPAPDLLLADTILDHHARSLRNNGDPRTLDQLRTDLLLTTILNPHTCHHPTTTSAATGTGTGTSTAAGTVTGSAGSATTGTGTAAPHAGSAGIDAATGTSNSPDGTPAGVTDMTGDDPFGILANAPIRARINVTVPLSTLLGTSDQPGTLEGYGPIDPTTARALAAGGIWRRIITDPVTNTVLNLGRTTYRPPTALADHIRARDKECVQPSCAKPASATDLDHTIEYHRHHGETTDTNLGPLCRRDHMLKTDAGHTLRQIRAGLYLWITPTGHSYLIEPGNNSLALHLTTPINTTPPHNNPSNTSNPRTTSAHTTTQPDNNPQNSSTTDTEDDEIPF